MTTLTESMFIAAANRMAEKVHKIAVDHGWWDKARSNGECVALIHSELSEALEAMRQGELLPDEHVSEFLNVEVELADAIIRIMDLAAAQGWRVAEALVAKVRYNEGREYKHGKRF